MLNYMKDEGSPLTLGIGKREGGRREKGNPRVNRKEGAKMESVSRRRGGGIFDGLYKVFMRRNSAYVTFIIAGAFFGERAIDYGVHKLWEANNVGKRYEDISVLGQRQSE
ncbi:hypothetical protein VNO78_17845 [Psophocarpus tetragonolobus]|uniref:Complex III subunit 9 n=1 Tax=Psophocarpus tetragonolobus TaxID=3891 RepID=A0AAN9XLI6_PSOTE